jgi:alpha-methylacyl-CoA racemase
VSGPLAGLRGVELGGIGPCPFAATVLADMGMDIVRVDRIAPARQAYSVAPEHELLNRGRRSISVNLKSPEGLAVVHRLAGAADVLLEGFRPGVTERLGLGPDELRAANPGLIYGRMTGWGQTGPLAQGAGHDLNYLALTGVLAAMGTPDAPPPPPLNVVGDFGGGGMLLAFGVVCALYEREQSGEGQVIDAAIVDGVALLSAFLHGARASGGWSARRGENLVDGGAHFYGTYETADGRYIAVGAIEEQFYAAFCTGLGIDRAEMPEPADVSQWQPARGRLAAIFLTRTRDEWVERFAGLDACVTPVLDVAEAIAHPHNVSRGTFAEHAGVVQPAPAPRLSRTPGELVRTPAAAGADTREVLSDAGYSESEIEALVAASAVA